MRRLLVHECQDDASDMFYCSAVVNDGQDLDWYVWEAVSIYEGQSVSCIEYCPFCGIKLPETINDEQQLENTFHLETQEEETQEAGEDPMEGLKDLIDDLINNYHLLDVITDEHDWEGDILERHEWVKIQGAVYLLEAALESLKGRFPIVYAEVENIRASCNGEDGEWM